LPIGGVTFVTGDVLHGDADGGVQLPAGTQIDAKPACPASGRERRR
jgi:regulator of RNase E activity RraA